MNTLEGKLHSEYWVHFSVIHFLQDFGLSGPCCFGVPDYQLLSSQVSATTAPQHIFCLTSLPMLVYQQTP